MRAFPCALALLLLAGCLGSTTAPTADPVQAFRDAAVCNGTVAGIDLQQVTVPALQGELAAGRVTSAQLVQAYLDRIAAFDGPLDAIREVNPHAMEEAQALDAERAAGHVRGPLHGIPILLKDNIGTRDEPTTAGSIALAANVPPADATLVRRLRDAGAVILGKTNLSEFAAWTSLTMPNGYSSLGGQVRNAYTGGDPSGSSSGSGVAGSMAMAAATVGTETQGSILGPSDANSLVGLKPTVGLVSRAGVIPLASHFDTPGPMARSVTDAAILLGALAGPDPDDAATQQAASHLPPGGDYTALLNASALRGARLGYDPGFNDPVFLRALDDLRRAGATVVPIQSNPAADDAGASELTLIFNEFKHDINQYLATRAGPGLPVSDLTGIVLYNQQHPQQMRYGQDLLVASDASPGNGALADASAAALVAGDRAFVDALFQRDRLDALAGPSLAYYQTGAAAGYPTLILPAGYNGRTPEGLSLFGPAWSEGRLLAYGYAYEQASHRRLPPTDLNSTLLPQACPLQPQPEPQTHDPPRARALDLPAVQTAGVGKTPRRP